MGMITEIYYHEGNDNRGDIYEPNIRVANITCVSLCEPVDNLYFI